MHLLLDTHIFLWWIKDDDRLSKAIRSLIANATEVYVSSVSIWEIAIKCSLGKLQLDMDKLAEAITASYFKKLPITIEHALAVAQLANIHRDPFDRLLIAQAIAEPLNLLTADPVLQQYSELVKLA